MNLTKTQIKTVQKITESVIACGVALHLMEEIKHTNYHKGRLKSAVNLAIKELIKAEKNDFDEFHEKMQEQTDHVFDIQREMIAEISDLGLLHYKQITEMVKAYKKDHKSIQGIVNKINR